MNEKIMIFSDVYGSLKYLLYFINVNLQLNNQITIVVSDNKNYFKLIEKINKEIWKEKIKVIYIEQFNSRYNNKLLRYFESIMFEKKYLKKIYRKYFINTSDYQIYFTVRKYKFLIFHFIAKLSSRNKIYLLDADVTTNEVKSIPCKLKEVLYYIKALYLYNKNLIFKREQSGFYVQVNAGYIKNNNISVLIRENYEDKADNALNKVKLEYSCCNKHKIIFFDQNILDLSNMDVAVVEKVLIKVFNILYKYYPKDYIVSKFHPFFKNKTEILKDLSSMVEDYIPAEFLISENLDFVISFHSNALKTNKLSKSISILYLLPFTEKQIVTYTNYLENNSECKVYFPKNYNEFEQIISQESVE